MNPPLHCYEYHEDHLVSTFVLDAKTCSRFAKTGGTQKPGSGVEEVLSVPHHVTTWPIDLETRVVQESL